MVSTTMFPYPMRRYEVRYAPPDGCFHPFEAIVKAEPYVERAAIHQMRLLTDDLGLMLFEFRGDVDRTVELMDELLEGLDHQVNEFDGRIFVYSLMIPNDLLREMLRIPRDFEVFLDPPMIYPNERELLVRYLATEGSFQRAMEVVPDGVAMQLEKKREYKPREETFVTELTPQQRKVFRVARELGYYRSPRNATYEDIGEEVGLSVGTVGEHLRKIEEKLVEFAVPTTTARDSRMAVPR